jgi:hypothetical protein
MVQYLTKTEHVKGAWNCQPLSAICGKPHIRSNLLKKKRLRYKVQLTGRLSFYRPTSAPVPHLICRLYFFYPSWLDKLDQSSHSLSDRDVITALKICNVSEV